jgi:hypothetical protein
VLKTSDSTMPSVVRIAIDAAAINMADALLHHVAGAELGCDSRKAEEACRHRHQDHRNGHHQRAGWHSSRVSLRGPQDRLCDLGGHDLRPHPCRRVVTSLKSARALRAKSSVIDRRFDRVVQTFGGAAHLGHHQAKRRAFGDRAVRDHAGNGVVDVSAAAPAARRS